jgi:hypothetical protein
MHRILDRASIDSRLAKAYRVFVLFPLSTAFCRETGSFVSSDFRHTHSSRSEHFFGPFAFEHELSPVYYVESLWNGAAPSLYVAQSTDVTSEPITFGNDLNLNSITIAPAAGPNSSKRQYLIPLSSDQRTSSDPQAVTPTFHCPPCGATFRRSCDLK